MDGGGRDDTKGRDSKQSVYDTDTKQRIYRKGTYIKQMKKKEQERDEHTRRSMKEERKHNGYIHGDEVREAVQSGEWSGKGAIQIPARTSKEERREEDDEDEDAKGEGGKK